jgi:hypothetical protein
MAKRILLLIVYILLTSSIIFITNVGEITIPGTALAFTSWSSLLIVPLLAGRGVLILCLYPAYLAILFFLTSILSTRADNWPLSGVALLHASFPAIIAIGALVSGRLAEFPLPWLQVLFFLASLAISSGYLAIDYRLARRSRLSPRAER